MFWLSGAKPSNWEQSAQPGDQEERWLSKYRGGGEISSTWNSIEWCTHTCRSRVWKWFMIRRLTRWRLPFRNHTIDICHYFEILNLDETFSISVTILRSQTRFDAIRGSVSSTTSWEWPQTGWWLRMRRWEGTSWEGLEMRMQKVLSEGDEWDTGEHDENSSS